MHLQLIFGVFGIGQNEVHRRTCIYEQAVGLVNKSGHDRWIRLTPPPTCLLLAELGPDQGFDVLVDRVSKLLHGYARHLVIVEDAKDALGYRTGREE